MKLDKTQRTRHGMGVQASGGTEHRTPSIEGTGSTLQNNGKTLVEEGVGEKMGQGHDGGQVEKYRAQKVERTGLQKKTGKEFSSPETSPLLEVSTLSKTSPSRSCAGPGPPPRQCH